MHLMIAIRCFLAGDSPPWSAPTRRRFCLPRPETALLMSIQSVRKVIARVASDQSADRSAHSKELTRFPLTLFSKIAKLACMKSVSRVFKALADPTRRQILQELKEGDLSAGEITARFPISGPSISRHLSILKAADLVEERREGNRIVYQLEPEQIAGVVGDFLSAVCPTQAMRNRKRKRSKS